MEGNNNPSDGNVSFDSSDCIRLQYRKDMSGNNYGSNRRLVIEKKLKEASLLSNMHP